MAARGLYAYALVFSAMTAQIVAEPTPEELMETMVSSQQKQLMHQAEIISQLLGNATAIEKRFAEASSVGDFFDKPIATKRVKGRRLTASPTSTDFQQSLDAMWVIVAGALVMFMQAGFAVLEAGSVREKNAGTVLLKNLIDVCVGTMMWWFIGWGIAYGVDPDESEPNKVVGTTSFAGSNLVNLTDSDPPAQTPLLGYLYPKDWFFQWAFCATAATIVSGGVAERVKLPVYVCYSAFMTGLIYPFVVYWTWSTKGWLTLFYGTESDKSGYSDFAGSGIVHLTGGIAALVGAVLCGPRAGRFESPENFYPHNMGLVALGTFILWFGWYGFNCGSTLYMSTSDHALSAGLVAMNTTMSAAAGGLTVFLVRFIEAMAKKEAQLYDLAGMCNGVLAGLVAVCAGVGAFEPGMALLVGIFGGLFYESGHWLLIKLKVDDPLDAFSVHGMGGIAGLLFRPLLCMGGADGDMFVAHVVGAFAIIAWSGGLTLLFLLPFKVLKMLTYDADAQEKGSDVHCSPPKAYTAS